MKALLTLLCLSFCALSFAQQVDFSVVSTDKTADDKFIPVRNATIEIINEPGKSDKTDEYGNASIDISNLSLGPYVFKISAPGYLSQNRTINLGPVMTLETIDLEPKIEEYNLTVEVVDEENNKKIEGAFVSIFGAEGNHVSEDTDSVGVIEFTELSMDKFGCLTIEVGKNEAYETKISCHCPDEKKRESETVIKLRRNHFPLEVEAGYRDSRTNKFVPISDVEISFADYPGDASKSVTIPSNSNNKRAVFSDIKEGGYRIKVAAKGVGYQAQECLEYVKVGKGINEVYQIELTPVEPPAKLTIIGSIVEITDPERKTKVDIDQEQVFIMINNEIVDSALTSANGGFSKTLSLKDFAPHYEFTLLIERKDFADFKQRFPIYYKEALKSTKQKNIGEIALQREFSPIDIILKGKADDLKNPSFVFYKKGQMIRGKIKSTKPSNSGKSSLFTVNAPVGFQKCKMGAQINGKCKQLEIPRPSINDGGVKGHKLKNC